MSLVKFQAHFFVPCVSTPFSRPLVSLQKVKYPVGSLFRLPTGSVHNIYFNGS